MDEKKNIYLCGYRFTNISWYVLCRNQFEAEILSKRTDLSLRDIKEWAKNRSVKIYPLRDTKGFCSMLELLLHKHDLKRYGVLSKNELFLASIYGRKSIPSTLDQKIEKNKEYLAKLMDIKERYLNYEY